jgi:ribose transport system substrate-binding protein
MDLDVTPMRISPSRRRSLALAGLIVCVVFATVPMLWRRYQDHKRIRIAIIPRTTGIAPWEPIHRGADGAASKLGAEVYWNAPTREDDVEAQISLVDQVVQRGYQGVVLAPDQSLALITPVRRALARGIPVVVVSSRLPMAGGDNLAYLVNDDETAGRLAAERAAQLLAGKGSVALLGVNPDISGIMIRAKSFELFLAQNYPAIDVVKRRGAFNTLHEQQTAEEILKSNPEVKVMVGLMWASARGALAAIRMHGPSQRIQVIGFDPDDVPFEIDALDSLVIQDSLAMGEQAIGLIAARRKGKPMPALIKFAPALVTRENVATEPVRRLTEMYWRLGIQDQK